MTNGPEFPMGRISVADANDGRYPLRAAMPETAPFVGTKVWDYNHPSLSQVGGTCVGHGWKHFHACAPFESSPTAAPTAYEIYDWAIQNDEWTENDNGDRNFGTSVRAGAKALQHYGVIAEYRHAMNIQDVVDWLGTKGPLVIGVNWYEGMSANFQDTLIAPTGRVTGGHCVMLQGLDTDVMTPRGLGRVLIRNSWGNWGPWQNGCAHLSFADLNSLLFSQGGDCVAALEVGIGPIPPAPTGLTFVHAEQAAVAAYNIISPGVPYNASWYRKGGAKSVIDAIAKRKAQG